MNLNSISQIPASAQQTVNSAASTHSSTVAFWRVVVAYGFFGFGYIVTATFIVAMTRAADVGMATENLVWLVVGLTSIPSVLFWQWLAGSWGLAQVLRCAYLVEAIGVLMAGLVQSPELVAAALLFGGALLGGTIAAITALGLSLGRLLLPANPAKAIAIMTAAFALGQLLGPSVAGRIAQSTDSFVLPSLLAASLLLIGVLLIPKLERA